MVASRRPVPTATTKATTVSSSKNSLLEALNPLETSRILRRIRLGPLPGTNRSVSEQTAGPCSGHYHLLSPRQWRPSFRSPPPPLPICKQDDSDDCSDDLGDLDDCYCCCGGSWKAWGSSYSDWLPQFKLDESDDHDHDHDHDGSATPSPCSTPDVTAYCQNQRRWWWLVIRYLGHLHVCFTLYVSREQVYFGTGGRRDFIYMVFSSDQP